MKDNKQHMKNKIKIPAANYSNLEIAQDILSDLGRIANDYRDKIQDPDEHLKNLMNQYYEIVNQASIEVNKRIDIWESLLFKYYKMHAIYEHDNLTYEYLSYIFPYRITKENNTLWVLEINADDNYNGGVIDKCYPIDYNWNYDTYLEEIDELYFRTLAMKRTTDVIDRRLERIKENK